jgi:hypothetical protein
MGSSKVAKPAIRVMALIFVKFFANSQPLSLGEEAFQSEKGCERETVFIFYLNVLVAFLSFPCPLIKLLNSL